MIFPAVKSRQSLRTAAKNNWKIKMASIEGKDKMCEGGSAGLRNLLEAGENSTGTGFKLRLI